MRTGAHLKLDWYWLSQLAQMGVLNAYMVISSSYQRPTRSEIARLEIISAGILSTAQGSLPCTKILMSNPLLAAAALLVARSSPC
jgi:hypothetical protein